MVAGPLPKIQTRLHDFLGCYDVGERKRCDVPEELLHGVASFREACPTAGIYPNSSPEANEKPLPRWQGLVTKQDISIQSHSQGSTLFDNVVDNP